MGDASQRVSDAEREDAALALRDDLVAGRLTLDEFAVRVERAYSARTAAELTAVDDDLPARPAAASSRRPTRLTAAVFSHVVKRGRLRLRRRSVAVSVVGDLDLDLRAATIDSAETTLAVLPFLGNVDVYVPEGVDVDVSGLTVLGRRRDWGRDAARRDAPRLRVRVLGLGTVDVWRVPPGLGGSFGEVIRALRAQQKQLTD